MHREDAAKSALHAAIALDLDAGKLYVRWDGLWHEGAPGSSGGIDVTPGQQYRCEVETTVLIQPLLMQGLLKLNFGDTQFDYEMPAGYSTLAAARERHENSNR